MKWQQQYDWKIIDQFILENPDLKNNEVACLFGCAASSISWRRQELGVQKMKMQYWTPTQIKWLLKLYKHIGDYEISLLFTEAYPKEKGWTLKHIEKKRLYLGLKRTKAQLQAIKRRNKLFGCWMVGSVHSWQTRGQAPIGEIRTWVNRDYIKTEKGYEILARHTYMCVYGSIPKGYNVVKKNRTKSGADITNLECISNAELAQRNSFHRYPIELKQTIIQLNKLKKQVYAEHQ